MQCLCRLGGKIETKQKKDTLGRQSALQPAEKSRVS